MRQILVPALVLFLSVNAFANTAIETETAQIGKKGEIGISQSIEFERSPDGKAGGTLTQFEYGLSDKSEILIEPFFYVWEHPSGEDKVSGAGDLEITPSYEVLEENGVRPTVLLALKVKVPTGAKEVGGSGKYDYYPYFIFGQHAGGWTFNSNLGMNFVTPEDGGASEQTIIWDLEAEKSLIQGWTFFFEVFSAEEEVVTYSTAAQYEINEHSNVFVALSYDVQDATVIRPGVNFAF